MLERAVRALAAWPGAPPGFASGRAGAVRLTDHARLPGGRGALVLLEVAGVGGTPDRYAVPLPDPRGGRPPDPRQAPDFWRDLVAAVRVGAVMPGRRGRFRGIPTPAFPLVLPDVPEPGPVDPVPGGRWRVACGEAAVLMFCCRPAPEPDAARELAEFLTHQGFGGIPRLLGSLTYEGPEGPGLLLGLLSERLPHQGDGWTTVLARLRQYLETVLEATTEGGAAAAAFARTLLEADAREARELGAVTAALHRALASGPPGTVFVPEPVTPAAVARWGESLEAAGTRALTVLAAALPSLPPPLHAPARALLDSRAAVRDRLVVPTIEPDDFVLIRLHGDYHLGRVVRTPRGFAVADLGADSALGASRRAPDCALRDVATMRHAYRAAARRVLRETAGSEPGLLARLGPAVQSWEDAVCAGFFEGYREAAAGAAFLPENPTALQMLLDAFELERALTELTDGPAARPEALEVALALVGAPAAPRPAGRPAARPGVLQPGQRPFVFTACLELCQFVGVRAHSIPELMELLAEVPLDSIYYHTHGFFLRHKFLSGAYPNDFATWVAVEVRDRVLGERLAMADPGAFADLQALREELVAVIDEHLRRYPGAAPLAGEPFDFIQSRIVEIPLALEVRTLQEFREALLEVDASALYYHLVEARVRLGRGQNDFAAWLETGLGLPELAARVRALDPYLGSLERTRSRLIQLCDDVLTGEPGR